MIVVVAFKPSLRPPLVAAPIHVLLPLPTLGVLHATAVRTHSSFHHNYTLSGVPVAHRLLLLQQQSIGGCEHRGFARQDPAAPGRCAAASAQ
jgi:hypothetical protein